MKNLKLTLLLALGLSFGALAQSPAGQGKETDVSSQYSTTVSQDKPAQANNLVLSLSPAIADMYLLNINVRYGAALHYRFGKYGDIYGGYSKAYYDRMPLIGEKYPSSDQPLKMPEPATFWNAGGTVYFSATEKNKAMRSYVKMDNRGRYYMNVPVTVLRLHGVRFGMENIKTYIHNDNLEIPFAGHQVNNPAIALEASRGNSGADMKMNVWHAGYSYQRVRNVRFEVSKLGRNSIRQSTEFYIDGIYAPNVKFGDIKGQGGAMFNLSDTKVNPWGVRMGLSSANLAGFGTSIGGEVGVRPGPGSFVTGVYGMMKFGIDISAKVH